MDTLAGNDVAMAELMYCGAAVRAEFVSFAGERGVDLTPFRVGSDSLLNDRGGGGWRMIFFFPWQGVVGYNMQGAIAVLSAVFADSAKLFQGSCHESGRMPNAERAAEFTVAWLAEYREVDQLPKAGREVHRWGIG